MAIKNGTVLGLYFTGTPTLISFAISNDMNFDQATRDTSNKSSGGHKTSLGGQLSWGMSVEFYMDEAATYGFSDLWTLQQARTPVDVVMSDQVTGNLEYGGSAHITNLSMSAPLEESTTCSGALEGTGAPSETTI